MDNPIRLSDTEFIDVCPHIKFGARDAKSEPGLDEAQGAPLLIHCKTCDGTFEFWVMMD